MLPEQSSLSESALSWTQPCCERCWIDAEGEFDLGVDEHSVWEHLVSLRRPMLVRNPPIERCAWCGGATFIGLYRRADPATVPYPARK